MNTSPPSAQYARIVRRETHSSRSILAITLAVVLVVAVAWLIAEIVLSLLGLAPLLAAPAQLAASVVELPSFGTTMMIVVGGVLAIVGVVLILLSLTPGRRARQPLESDRSAVVADNAVIASALARHAARAGAIDPNSVRVTVGHRTATVEISPTSGATPDQASITEAISQQLESLNLRRTITPRIVVHPHGKVGA